MLIKSSGLKAASALIHTGSCSLIGVSFTADTLKFPTLTVYDSITAANTAVAVLRPVSSTTDVTNGTTTIMFPGKGLFCTSGLYASLSGVEGDYIIYYTVE
uniref:Uncharacterized protein n=1 Tax=viral metagenome TaxID=1070528 RepID=A0A6M3LEL7_9ZZZZ